MQIGMILDNEFTGDVRVANEVQSLQSAGHQVFVLCYTYGDKPQREIYCGATIVRFPVNKWWKNKIKGLNYTLFNIFPHWWKGKITKFLDDFDIDVLHVHDLWMMQSALLAVSNRPTRIVLDLHENFVSAIGQYRYSTTFPGNLLISQDKWRRAETKWLKAVDHIIVVIEEARERVLKLGIDEDKISVVPNYVNIEDYSLENSTLTNKLIAQYQGCTVATYTGGFDYHRGLEVLIRAVKTVIESYPDFKLVLVGGGSNEGELKDLVGSLQLDNYVTFAGYLPHTDLPSYVAASDICLIPHLKNEHTDNTIPHKLFQYMLKKKPIVASDCNPIKRIIEQSQSGVIYKSDDARGLASSILSVLKSGQNTRDEMGRRGHEAVITTYNWETAASTLVKLYDEY